MTNEAANKVRAKRKDYLPWLRISELTPKPAEEAVNEAVLACEIVKARVTLRVMFPNRLPAFLPTIRYLKGAKNA